MPIKNKINIIRPTLRHKKIYVILSYSKDLSSFNLKNLYDIIEKNLEKTYGIFVSVNINFTLISVDNDKKELFIRINKKYLRNFLSSLFFLKEDFGLISIKKIKTTIKKSKK
jgi:RNase P/RNase MRP subunit POP5